jgi:polyphosphate kinase 2 (PPK2 family)
VLDDRILGRIDDKSLARAFDEINEFEAQQRDYGTLIVKLYFDVGPEVQEARLHRRASGVWGRFHRDDDSLRVADPLYAKALADLRANSNTRWSPWHVIDGDDEEGAVLAALTAISDAWADAMPAEPPRLVGDVA